MNDVYYHHQHWLEIDLMQMIHVDKMKIGIFMKDDEVIYDASEQVIHLLSLLLSQYY